jgi:hypothetical protein
MILTMVERIRSAVGWTVGWFLLAGAASLPLGAVPMPSSGSPCHGFPTDPAWAAWLFRDTLWLSLAVYLPVSAGVTAVLAWRTSRSVRVCTAIGVGVGFVLVLANVVQSMATATCTMHIQLGNG